LKNIIILPAVSNLKFTGISNNTPTEEQVSLFLVTCSFYQTVFLYLHGDKYGSVKFLIKKCLCAMYEQVRAYKIDPEAYELISKMKSTFFETVLYVWTADMVNKDGDWELLGIMFEDYSIECLLIWQTYLKVVTEIMGLVTFGVPGSDVIKIAPKRLKKLTDIDETVGSAVNIAKVSHF